MCEGGVISHSGDRSSGGVPHKDDIFLKLGCRPCTKTLKYNVKDIVVFYIFYYKRKIPYTYFINQICVSVTNIAWSTRGFSSRY